MASSSAPHDAGAPDRSRWAADGPRPLLSRAEAHVWLLDPGRGRAHPSAQLLGAAERVRLGRLHRAAQADGHRQVLASSLLVRAALSAVVPDVRPGQWVLGRSRRGRPEVVGPAVRPPLRLSLSHDPGLVACLVVVDADCGVDVERVEDPGERDTAFDRPAAAVERVLGAGGDGRDRWVRAAAWALTEAHGKALGTGLDMEPGECVVVWDGDRVRVAPSGSDPTRWWHTVLPHGDRYVLAAAVRDGGHRLLVVHDDAESARLVRMMREPA